MDFFQLIQWRISRKLHSSRDGPRKHGEAMLTEAFLDALRAHPLTENNGYEITQYSTRNVIRDEARTLAFLRLALCRPFSAAQQNWDNNSL